MKRAVESDEREKSLRAELDAAHERLRSLIAFHQDGHLIVDDAGVVRFTNPAAERLLGRSEADLVGHRFGAPLGSSSAVDLEILRAEGGNRIVEMRATDTEWDGGRATLVALRDVTAERRATEERDLVQRAVRAMATDLDPEVAFGAFAEVVGDAVPHLAVITLTVSDGDSYRRVVTAGPQAERFPVSGRPISGDSALGEARQTGAVIVNQDANDATYPNDPDLVAVGVHSYLVFPLKDAEEVFATVNVGFRKPYAVTDDVQRLLSLVLVAVVPQVRNVLMHEQQVAVTERLRQLDDIKNDFLAMVAHDLRNPLATIQAFAETMAEGVEDMSVSERRKLLERITSISMRMSRQVSELLEAAKAESGQIRYERRSFDFADLVEETVEEIHGSTGRQIDLVSPDSLPTAVGDPDRHQQVLTNLLGNAAMYSPEDTPIVVELNVRDADTLQVSIRDRGGGIPKEQQEKMFDRYVRASGGTRGGHSSGLGLWISRQIVEGQGGRIWVESEEGEGSVFHYTVPTN